VTVDRHLHAEARTLLAMMVETGAPPLDSQEPGAARAARRELAPAPTETCHEIRDLDAGGVPARLYLPPPTGTPPGLLVFFHGGGWVIGDLDSHDNICRSLTNRSGHAVLSVGYRLAPEDPFPAGLDDCTHATRWAHAHAATLGVDPDRIALGGDSAGANLAVAVGHAAPAPIAFQLLVYPAVDARMGRPSYDENAEGYFLTTSSMQWFTDHYLSGPHGSVDDPRVSPLLASDEVLAQSPPTLVITAEFDPLRDEGIAYANTLAALDVPVSHIHFAGQFHAFFSLPHMLGDARSAHALAAQALVNAFEPPPQPI
jgi:acetyl esterase